MSNKPSIIIKQVEEHDISSIWPIIESNSDNDRELFFQRVRNKMVLDDHYIPVAIMDGLVAGYAWVHDYGPHIRVGHRTARLNDLFVSINHRRQGVGKELFLSVKSWCARRNVKWLQWQSSEKAIAFYEKLGYKGERCPDPDHPFFEIEFETKVESN